eukprot:gene3409-3682_t
MAEFVPSMAEVVPSMAEVVPSMAEFVPSMADPLPSMAEFGILQGIDANLQAKLLGTVAAEAAPAVKPAAAAPTMSASKVATTLPAQQGGSMKSMGRRLLLSAAAGPLHWMRRVLLSRGRYRSNDGYNQATANSIASTNTQLAIRAAADGNIPVGAATRYGSYQAQAAAEYGSNCWNCRNW